MSRNAARLRRACAMLAATAMGAALSAGAAHAEPDPLPTQPDPPAAAPAEPAPPSEVPLEQRDSTIGSDWAASPDIAWTTVSTPTGVSVLAATKDTGYAWRTITTLGGGRGEPVSGKAGWLSNACVTSDGEHLAIAYAPAGIENDGAASARGARKAIVDLRTGEAQLLEGSTSIAYYNPGCGSADQVAFIADAIEQDIQVKIDVYDAPSAGLSYTTVRPGVVTSPVPTPAGVVAAVSDGLVMLGPDGSSSKIALVEGIDAYPYDIRTDATGGILFAARSRSGFSLMSVPDLAQPAAVQLAATGPAEPIRIAAGAPGALVADIGTSVPAAPLPAGTQIGEVSRTQTLSTSTDLSVDQPAPQDGADVPLQVHATVRGTGAEVDLSVAAADLPEPGAPGEGGGQRRLTAPVEGPLDDGPACGVARNDASKMAYQPKHRQIEWAVDMVVEDTLSVTRPANYNSNGLASYNIDTMLGHTDLAGGGRIPAQILLGILAQESNLQQVSRALPGEFGNPLIGNYYGRDVAPNSTDPWGIRWTPYPTAEDDKSDCGYGVAQITDDMRADSTVRSQLEKDAIALDYVANIAESANILAEKWNELLSAGMTVNTGEAGFLENWYFAIWAYNTGLHPYTGAGGGPWGVGWINNPVNPRFDTGRDPFLETSPADAAQPQRWPYQEKVLGFAAYSLEVPVNETTTAAGYSFPGWTSSTYRAERSPTPDLLCVDWINDCELDTLTVPTAPDVAGEPMGPCQHQNALGEYDLQCYFHMPINYKDALCDECGTPNLRYDSSYGEPAGENSYPANCVSTGLPAGSVVVDDQLSSWSPHRPCAPAYTPTGTFTLEMATESSRIDLHQLSGGSRGHYWFSHMMNPDDDYIAQMPITGTWQFPSAPASGWGRILVHLPDHGAEAQQAGYTIDTGSGTQTRYVNQKHAINTWVSLGTFEFSAAPAVSLSNVNLKSRGVSFVDPQNTHPAPVEEVAWDAVALVPLSAKPANFVVAMGDSYASGEGAGAYSPESNINGQYPDNKNDCHRSDNSWSRKSVLPDSPSTIGVRADALQAGLDYHVVSCSGAKSSNLLPTGQGQEGEVSQIDAGYLDANTTLVTLSIGGNDAYFGDILKNCILLHSLPTQSCANGHIAGLPNGSIGDELPGHITDVVKPAVKSVLEAIQLAAPNAKILLMGYPELMSMDCIVPQDDDATWMNDMAGLLDASLEAAVLDVDPTGDDIAFGDPVSAFSGHGACSGTEFIHHAVWAKTLGEEPGLGVSHESFHPNSLGTTAYASVATPIYAVLL